MNKQDSLRLAAININSKQPKGAQGEIDIDENRARIVLPVGMPVSVLTMMEVAQACLLYGCVAYVQNLITRDALAIVLYYEK